MKQFLKRHNCLFTTLICLPIFVINTNAQWSELGGVNSLSANQFIYTICADSNSNIYAGGNFTNANGKNFVAKWDGNSWTELGGINGLAANAYINNICLDKDGNLYAAGAFANSSGKLYVAKWDGNAWSEVPRQNGFVFNGVLNGLICDSVTNLYTAGGFTNASNHFYVAKWNKSTGQWTELGGVNALAANHVINAICIDKAGNIYAAGNFTNVNGKGYVAKWDGISWTELGGLNSLSANNNIRALYADNVGNIYAGGAFTDSSGKRYTAKWNATNNEWSKIGQMDGDLKQGDIGNISGDNQGNIYVSGGALREATSNYFFIDKWDGNNWSKMGASFIGGSGAVFTTCSDKNGYLYAGGAFVNANHNSYIATNKPTITPVKLIDFVATHQGTNGFLKWQTATELNTKHFIIQHSTMGEDFSKIGIIKARGNGANTYFFTDDKPVNGMNYYRLKSIDHDGSYTYSNVVSVNIDNKQSVAISPNPAKDFTTISFKKKFDKASIVVYDVNGNEMNTQLLSESVNNYHLNTQTLTNGFYFIKIKTNTGIYNVKLLISK
jgi:Secretion system C-terminal sorting domain